MGWLFILQMRQKEWLIVKNTIDDIMWLWLYTQVQWPWLCAAQCKLKSTSQTVNTTTKQKQQWPFSCIDSIRQTHNITIPLYMYPYILHVHLTKYKTTNLTLFNSTHVYTKWQVWERVSYFDSPFHSHPKEQWHIIISHISYKQTYYTLLKTKKLLQSCVWQLYRDFYLSCLGGAWWGSWLIPRRGFGRVDWRCIHATMGCMHSKKGVY